MTEPSREPDWSDVGRRFEELGRALRGHFAGAPDAPGEGAGTADRADAGGAADETGTASGAGGAADQAGTASGAGGAADEAGTASGAGGAADEAGTASDHGDREAVRDALRGFGAAARRLGDQAGEAVRDPAVRESAQRVARTLGEALEATIGRLGVELRGRSHPAGEADPAEGGGSSPPPAISGADGPVEPSAPRAETGAGLGAGEATSFEPEEEAGPAGEPPPPERG